MQKKRTLWSQGGMPVGRLAGTVGEVESTGRQARGKPKGVAKVAAARKLAVRLYWMLPKQVAYPKIVGIESSSRVPLVGAS